MSDPTRDDRKRLLDDARRALRAGDLRQMRAAFDRLPASGRKAEALRSELRSKIATGASVIRLPPRLPSRTTQPFAGTAVKTTIGLKYRFAIVHWGHSTLFRPRLHGAVVEIVVNASHQAFACLSASEGEELSDLGKKVLVAWATLHLEAGSERNREKVDDLAAEWARALGALQAGGRSDDESIG